MYSCPHKAARLSEDSSQPRPLPCWRRCRRGSVRQIDAVRPRPASISVTGLWKTLVEGDLVWRRRREGSEGKVRVVPAARKQLSSGCLRWDAARLPPLALAQQPLAQTLPVKERKGSGRFFLLTSRPALLPPTPAAVGFLNDTRRFLRAVNQGS